MWRLLNELEQPSDCGEWNVTTEVVTLTEENPDSVDVPEDADVLKTDFDGVTVWVEPEP